MAIPAMFVCSGIESLGLGLDLATGGAIRPILYVEIEAYCASVLAARMEEGALAPAAIWSNVKTLCSADCRDYVRTALGGRELGVLFGGYPCQPFSTAGKRAGSSDPRHLWPWIARAVEAYQPNLCFFENVPGLISTPTTWSMGGSLRRPFT